MIQRRGNRTKAVLPVRIKGKDKDGNPFEELAHTLDVTAVGARLGAIRHELNLQDEITIFYRLKIPFYMPDKTVFIQSFDLNSSLFSFLLPAAVY